MSAQPWVKRQVFFPCLFSRQQAEANMDDDILWQQNKQDLVRQNWTSALAAGIGLRAKPLIHR